MSPAIARKTLKLPRKQKNEETQSPTDLIDSLLSEREREVLMHMVNGYNAKRISELIKYEHSDRAQAHLESLSQVTRQFKGPGYFART
ncbi:hypothetical protein EMGBS15_07030 [Filimonas sp.]|nr:hypothetical protein EMGBS15_07030 [Filimonas sp.]